MKIAKTILLVVTALSLFMPRAALAQAETPHVIGSTKPISEELKAHLDAWLATDAPSSAPYYIVTNVDEIGVDYWIVSLAGVELESPAEEWTLEDEQKTVWIGSVYVGLTGEVTSFTLGSGIHRTPIKIFALPLSGPGGGSYVAFPFQAGTAMIYGVRAVHGAGDYGTSGMLAVDLLSGDDLGSGAAPPYAYASDSGVIDFVCDDGTSVAVRTYNSETEDYFLYAHLLDNANLTVSTEFSRGERIGSIKYGSFDDDCGWAEQQEDHYHLHWMFVPGNGSFQAEGCVLNIANKKWVCGSETIGTGGWIRGGGGFGVGGLDNLTGGSGATAERSFWDYILVGFMFIFDEFLLKTLPEHKSMSTWIYMIYSVIKLMFQIAWILERSGSFSIFPLISLALWSIYMWAWVGVVWVVAFLLKMWKSLVPVAGA